MILIFDFFETIMRTKSMDFNRGLKGMWEKYYIDRCSFEEIAAYGEELYRHMQELHKQGTEFAFVKDELPKYAEKYGGDTVKMSAEEETDFLMKCDELEIMPYVGEALVEFDRMGIPMYVLSNSGFTAEALTGVLKKAGIRKYFKKIWSSADFGRIKPDKDFFDMAIGHALRDNPQEKKENIVFVGDTYASDVKGANNAGIDVIWINPKREKNTENLSVYDIGDTRELLEAVMRCHMNCH